MAANTCSIVEHQPLEAADLLHDGFSIDALEQLLVEEELEIARHRSTQIAVLQLLDRAQVATADGARNLPDWVAARLDVGIDTAQSLVRTMRRTETRPELRNVLADAEATFDRVEAASLITDPGPDPLFLHLDVNGLRREAAVRTRSTAEEEQRSIEDTHLILQPSLDRSWWKAWGGFDGMLGAVIDQGLSELADQLPVDPDSLQANNGAWRRAVALAQLCVGDEPSPAQISIFIDAATATPADGEAGIYLEAGTKVGRQALEAILCESANQLIVDTEQGEPMRYGPQVRTIPPALRRAVIHRDHNRCVLDGSRNRLQVHHIIPRSQGGDTVAENLITLCWYCHHVAIHRMGLELYRHPDHGRWRLRRPQPVRGPPG